MNRPFPSERNEYGKTQSHHDPHDLNLPAKTMCLPINKKSRYRLLGNDLFIGAQRRPTLTGGNPQLPSAQKSLTSVFGMGTGVTSLPSSLDDECLFTQNWINRHLLQYIHFG